MGAVVDGVAGVASGVGRLSQAAKVNSTNDMQAAARWGNMVWIMNGSSETASSAAKRRLRFALPVGQSAFPVGTRTGLRCANPRVR